MKKHNWAIWRVLLLLTAFYSCNQRIPHYAIVYLDLDGTALDTTGTIREATIRAIRAFKQGGGKVGIATGRNWTQAQEAITQLQPNLPVVLFNGGMIVDQVNKDLKVLGHLDSTTLQLCLNKISKEATVEGIVLHFPSVSIADRISAKLNDLASVYHLRITFRDNLRQVSADSLLKIAVVCIPGCTEQVRDNIKLIVDSSEAGAPHVVISDPITIEILPREISKAAAIKKAVEQCGYSLAQVVAFGDSENDVEMLRAAGLGIAMGNGRPEAQSVADLIIGPNYSDAIAKFLDSPFMQ